MRRFSTASQFSPSPYLCEHPPNTCMFFQLQISYVINTIFYFCMEKGQIFFYIFAKHLTHRKMQVGNIRDFIFLLFWSVFIVACVCLSLFIYWIFSSPVLLRISLAFRLKISDATLYWNTTIGFTTITYLCSEKYILKKS